MAIWKHGTIVNNNAGQFIRCFDDMGNTYFTPMGRSDYKNVNIVSCSTSVPKVTLEKYNTWEDAEELAIEATVKKTNKKDKE